MISAARPRDDVKRLKAVELAVIDDPTVRQSNIKDATASWPQPKGERRASSKAGKPGTRAPGANPDKFLTNDCFLIFSLEYAGCNCEGSHE
jgi:hypothetical protein